MEQIDILKRLKPVVHSTNWERLEDYLADQRQVLVETLIKSTDIKQINKLQGELLGIDKILDLPETLKKLK